MAENNSFRKELNNLSESLIKMHVTNVLSKHNISNEQNRISKEQKNELRNVVENLQEQVNQFLNEQEQTDQSSEEDKNQGESPLRQIFKGEKK